MFETKLDVPRHESMPATPPAHICAEFITALELANFVAQRPRDTNGTLAFNFLILLGSPAHIHDRNGKINSDEMTKREDVYNVITIFSGSPSSNCKMLPFVRLTASWFRERQTDRTDVFCKEFAMAVKGIL